MMNILPLAAMIKRKSYTNQPDLETQSNASSDYNLSPLLETKGWSTIVKKIKKKTTEESVVKKVISQSARITKKKAELN